jgi:hypothetical protein
MLGCPSVNEQRSSAARESGRSGFLAINKKLRQNALKTITNEIMMAINTHIYSL